MDKRKENILILTTFFILLAFIVLTITPNKKIVSTNISGFLKAEARSTSETQIDVEKKAVSHIAGEKDIISAWGRDPFKSRWTGDVAIRGETNLENVIKGEDPLLLSLILISETDRTATVNNRIFREGDMLQEERLLKIQKSGIVLEKDGYLRILPLHKKTVNLCIEESTAGGN
jgi:hypothetical protein